MAKHLYLRKDTTLGESTGGNLYFFGINPTGSESHDDFFALNRRISLKNDLKWGEVAHLQQLFRGAGIWDNFPSEGLKFICAESKLGDEDQRIDLLYLRDDGGLYPCELKIGGYALDVHGQLIRYIADLCYQPIDTQWIINARIRYLDMQDERDITVATKELNDFFSERGITDQHVHLIKNAGIIVDEEFKSQAITAVRYLNEQCGFSIRLLRLDAFAAEDWSLEQPEFRVRIDIVEVQ